MENGTETFLADIPRDRHCAILRRRESQEKRKILIRLSNRDGHGSLPELITRTEPFILFPFGRMNIDMVGRNLT